MSREAQTKVIKDVTYSVTQLPPKQALDLLMDLIKMLGPALSPILANVTSMKGGLLEKDVGEVLKSSFISEAVNTLFTQMDKGVVMKMINQLADVTTITFPGGATQGANLKSAFDAHFMGNLGALMQWIPFALHVQFADPLSDLGSVIAMYSPKSTAQATQLPPA
jgi:hypothetical protein